MAAIQESRYDEPASHFAKAVQANPSFTSPRFLLAMTFGERWTHRGSLFYPVVRGPTFRRGGVAAAAARVMKAIAVVAIELPIAQRRERQLSPHGLNRSRGRRGERRLGLAEG
jgi:hypothetical protein